MAYSFHVNGGGVRFRQATNERFIEGIRFVDYNNLKIENAFTSLENLAKAFEKGKLEKLSEKLEGAEFSEMAELIIKENDKRIKPANLQGEFKQVEENSPLKPLDWDKFIQETKNEIKK